jgi:outer membrane protein assembly factor BamD (BamD/ComL family)
VAAEIPLEAPAPVVPAPVVAANVPSAPAATASSLPEEVRSLDAARTALAEGDARGALALLRRYDATFGTGALLPEARVLEVKALLAAGERARAVAVAKRITDLDPKSPHAEAVRALLARSSFP